MVVLAVHAAQQNSLIGSNPKIKFFHWSRQCHQYLGPYMISPNKSLTMCAPYTYIQMSHTSHFMEELSSVPYLR